MASKRYKRIDIVIDEKGKAHIQTSGFIGKSCIKESEVLIKKLQEVGLEVTTEDLKRTKEYYARETSRSTNMLELSRIQTKVARILARKGPKTCFEIFKEDSSLAVGSVRDALISLERKHLVRLEHIEKHKPKDKKYYTLTGLGLLIFLWNGRNWDSINDIIKVHDKVLPLVFGNWEYFSRQGVTEQVKKLTQEFLSDYEQYLGKCAETIEPLTEDTAEEIKEESYEETPFIKKQLAEKVVFLGQDPRFVNPLSYVIIRHDGRFLGKQEFLAWLKIIVGNDKLKQFAIDRLEKHQSRIQRELRNIRAWKRLLREALKHRNFIGCHDCYFCNNYKPDCPSAICDYSCEKGAHVLENALKKGHCKHWQGKGILSQL